MKKILLTCFGFATLFLTACADKEAYEQAVLAEMTAEQDVKDYKLDPGEMTKCVVDHTAEKMPGLFPFDPDRLMTYQNYTKMLSMNTVEDKKKAFEELRTVFGSPKALADAHGNYTQSIMDCITAILAQTEDKEEI